MPTSNSSSIREIGRDNLRSTELRRTHDAVLIACGVYKPREINGDRASGHFPASSPRSII